MRHVSRRLPTASAIVVLAVLTAASLGQARSAQPATADATTIRVKAFEFGFALSAKSAPRGTVTFVVKNIGLTAHDFHIDGRTTPLIASGATARLTVKLSKPGKYPYRCTVGTHALGGMKGVFVVR